jgi:serine/threonine protein kinase/tetratricopeptide (TPR) repeat protein
VSERFKQIETLFKEAMAAPPAHRAALLSERCGGDDDLRREVEALLAEDETAGDFLEEPAVGIGDGAPALGAPDRIGGYRVIGVLGVGGMGVVYEAQQESPRRSVALKVISALGLSQIAMRRFEHESDVLGRLRHPGIAQIYEAGTAKLDGVERPFFAMEIVRGEPITAYAENHNLSTRERLELIRRLCEAVQHAHQNGVIHRDLKPGNVLVDELGQPKILDFGIARATDSDVQTTTMRTSVGELIGTLAYMSPEQASGDPEEIDTRSDVYAIGVIAYELLTGRLPLDLGERMVHEAVRVIRDEEPQRLSRIKPRLGGDVETITAKALEKDKTRRYQTCAALAGDIERYLADQPILARPPSATYQLRKFARRNKPLVAAGAIIATSLVATTAVSTVFAVNEARQRKLASEAAEAESIQRKRAEKRFNDVRALANTFLFPIHDEIAQLPGSTKARQQLVETGITYLDSLAQEAGDDAELLAELAEAYGRIGDILGNPRRQNLGDVDGALESHRKSVELRTLITELDPSPEARISLAASRRRLGSIKAGTGRTAEGLEDLRQCRLVLASVLADHPDNARAKRDMASILAFTGSTLSQMGRMEEALQAMQECLAIDESLVETAEDKDAARRLVGGDLNEIGQIQIRMGDFDAAETNFKRSLSINTELAARHPLNVRYQRSLGIVHTRLGNLSLERGHPDKALESYREALLIFDRIAADDPSDVRAQRDGAVANEKVGNALRQIGRFDEAFETFEQCADRWRSLVDRLPGSVIMEIGLAVAVERSADVLTNLERFDEALPRYAEAHELAAGVVDRDPQDALAGTAAVTTAKKAAEILSRDGQSPDALTAALQWCRKGLTIAEGMAALDVRPLSGGATVAEMNAAIQAIQDRLGG